MIILDFKPSYVLGFCFKSKEILKDANYSKWKTLAGLYASNSKVIFDCNNEPHDMGSASVPKLMQACIDGVRAAGATSQYIFVEGTVRTHRPPFYPYSTNRPFVVLHRSMDVDHNIWKHQSGGSH
jgi:Cellulase (glycosyl hydrolase family 5)